MRKQQGNKDNRRSRGGQGQLRSQRISTRKAESLVAAAQQAWKRQHFDRAIAMYKEALRRDPRNADLMVDIARAYGLRQNFTEAEEYVERAIRSDPKRARIQFLAGETYWIINRLDEAAACFQKVLELNPDSPDGPAALVTLARYHERHHRVEEAQEAIDRALQLQPNHEEAQLQRAILTRRRRDPQRAIGQLRDMLGGGCRSLQITSDAWYELGQLLDAEGDYGNAIDAFCRAKELLRRKAGKHLESWNGVRKRNERMLEALTPDHFQRWQERGPASSPMRLALLTGHPRSGTTLIEQVLDSHPDLVSADEFTTFSDWVFIPLGKQHPTSTSIPMVLERTPDDRLERTRHDYWTRTEAMLGQPIGGRLLLDKNPELTYLLPVANCVFPEMRVLFALRDPRDVVLSCFMQKLPLNSVSVNYLSLEETAHKYAHVMRTWLRVRELTKAAWIEVRYEDTVQDVEAQARRLLEFLELPWNASVLEFYRHAQAKLVRSPTYEAVTRPVHGRAVGRWRNYAKYIEPHIPVLQQYLDEFGYD